MTPAKLRPLIALVALALVPASARAARKPPNVIIVFPDDVGYGDLSVHGNPVVKTPNIDRLASQSVRFTDFHVSAMCTPTRGQLLSGVDALRNGAANVSSGRSLLRSDLPTMADMFRAGGYKTALFGKWHLGDNHPYRPQDRGFDEVVTFRSSHVSSASDHWNNDYFDDTYLHNGEPQAYRGFCTDVFFREAETWIERRAANAEPFFVYLSLNAAHWPFFAPEADRKRYAGEKGDLPGFFGMIANIDANVGKLEQKLETLGIRDDTILAFLSDNGTVLGHHVFNAGMRGHKTELFEGGHRVPLFVRWPAGRLTPREVPGLTHVQDLLPTLADLAGLRLPGRKMLDGVSLAGVLRGRGRVPDRTLVVQFSTIDHPAPLRGEAAVMWRRWRLVGDRALYDLATDPGQEHDVAARHPDIVKRLRAHYGRWWNGVAPYLSAFGVPTIGHEAEPASLLSPTEWHDVFLDQSLQVRRGEPKFGQWRVTVAHAGTYVFSLRRWPVESGLALAAPAPSYQSVAGIYEPGKALPIREARLTVQDHDLRMKVAGSEQEARFEVALQEGPATIKARFYDKDGQYPVAGAYFVYVQRK